MVLRVKTAVVAALEYLLGLDVNGKVRRMLLIDTQADTDDFFRAEADGSSRGVPAATAAEGVDNTNDENPTVPTSLAGLRDIGSAVTAASSIEIPSDGIIIPVSGDTTIAGVTYANGAGRPVFLVFSGTPQLTHNATSFILPGGANLTMAAGNVALVIPTGTSSNVRLFIWKADGTPIVGSFTSYTAPTTTVAAILSFLEGTDNGTNKVNLKGVASLSADADVVLPGASGDILSTNEGKTILKGFNATEEDLGTKSSGTLTPDPLTQNFKKVVNGGAFTLAPPGSTCNILLQITNNGSAGAITTSGFTKVIGDAFTTTNGDDFMCHISRVNSFSMLNVVALQ